MLLSVADQDLIAGSADSRAMVCRQLRIPLIRKRGRHFSQMISRACSYASSPTSPPGSPREAANRLPTRVHDTCAYVGCRSLVLRRTKPCPRPDWSRPLPRPLIIPDVADVRGLIEKHLPAEYRSEFTWRQLAGLIRRAAEGQQDMRSVPCQ